MFFSTSYLYYYLAMCACMTIARIKFGFREKLDISDFKAMSQLERICGAMAGIFKYVIGAFLITLLFNQPSWWYTPVFIVLGVLIHTLLVMIIQRVSNGFATLALIAFPICAVLAFLSKFNVI